jgi:2-oxoglutarate ferredoxin oxidoreductase subunit beta
MGEPAERTTYLRAERMPYPFCPGCGHSVIMDQLDAALVQLQLDPHRLVVVVDIGCVALCREYFDTNWMLGLHGRSVTYATGIKLANPDLTVLVLMGDGGLGIGGHHLINAARRNIGVTVLLFNNLNFGMTGGEHSVTTLPESLTATTPHGNLERPLDACATARVNGATFVARTTTFEPGLADLIARAIENDGFSLVDMWEPCTSYFVPQNRFGRPQMKEAMAALHFDTGVLHEESRPEYSRAYRASVAGDHHRPLERARPVAPTFSSAVTGTKRLVVAGGAGQKIQSTTSLFTQAALLAGLWVSQRSDYPVAVKSGYSVSEVILSPEEILFIGVSKPDLMVVLFPEGLNRVQSSITKLGPQDRLYLSAGLGPVETRAEQVEIDFERTGPWANRKRYWALMALAHLLRREGLFPIEALQAAIASQGAHVEENLAAVEAATRLEG